MGTPLGAKYIPYTYMDPLGYHPTEDSMGATHEIHSFTPCEQPGCKLQPP